MVKNRMNDSRKGRYSTYAWTEGGKLVKLNDSTDIVTDSVENGVPFVPANGKDAIEWARRGRNNDLPYLVLKKVGANVTVGSNVEHKEKIIMGDGILVYRKKRDDAGRLVKEEVLESEAPEIFRFINDNDYEHVREELANDLVIFGDAFVQYIFNREDKPKLVQVKALETSCSRISLIDEDTGKIEWHGYSAEWQKGTVTDLVATPLLHRQTPMLDLRQRMGLEPDDNGVKKAGKDRTFVHNLRVSTPGRFYYAKPYWWSVFASGWYDFASAIPVYKKSLIKNQMSIRYMVYIKETFWDGLYKELNLAESDKEKRAQARREFLEDLEKYLTGEDNAGKSFVTHFRYDKLKGFLDKDVIIEPLKNEKVGGEYIEDSEEVSNTICYAMGVHPSIIGASPGKGKTINGTEARELFIIEQALMKRYQELTLAPLYAAKMMNGWDADIYFSVVNTQLTTLDKGTGAVKNTGLTKETEEK